MPRTIAAEFAAIASELAQHHTVGDTLQAIVEKAATTIDGADSAGITVRDGNRQYTTVAATDALARQVDLLQHEIGEGPCLGTISDGHIFCSNDIGADPRWPTFGPLARSQTPVVSMLSHLLFIDDDTTLGALNVYSRKPDAFSILSIHALDLLATHSAIAIGRVNGETQNDHLKIALDANRNVDMAIGIVVASLSLTEEHAFDLLRVASQHSHRKVIAVALDVIHTGQLDATLVDRTGPLPTGPAGPATSAA